MRLQINFKNVFSINLVSQSKRKSRFPQYLQGISALKLLFKLGKSLPYLKLFCLSFIWNLPIFYFICTFYFGLLIFCCQSVATNLLYQSQQIKQLNLPINNQFTNFIFYQSNHIFYVVQIKKLFFIDDNNTNMLSQIS